MFIPKFRVQGQLPTADLHGTLVVHDDCVWIDTGSQQYLALWPSDFDVRVESSRWSVAHGEVVVTEGEEISVGGGEYGASETSFVEGMIGEPVPTACQGAYWLVTGLL